MRPPGTRARRRFTLAAALLGLISAVICLVVLDWAFPPPIEQSETTSLVIMDRDGHTLRAFPVEDGRWRLAADLDRIDPAFVEALVAIEDERFFLHGGVDPLAVVRAAGSALVNGRITSGASTITMQTVRLLRPRRRTIGAKIVEALRAIQIERRFAKREILELYLTLTPYGGNLQGVRTASWAWFDREPDTLTPDQIALLIALPQAPEARRPDRRPEAAIEARERVLTRMAALGITSKARALEASEEPAPGRHAFPAEAWHAAEEVRARSDAIGEVLSTLDVSLQREAERIVRRVAGKAGEGVQAAAIVVEVEGTAVRAAVGSAGLDRAGGWLDLTDRPRSPGSALKPLIYGLAFDDGLAAPETLIEDVPRRYASYQPANFDARFRGEVTIGQALQHSLNVPAVQVLDEVGANRFAAALAFAGGAPAMPKSAEGDAGLAVALGGLGLSARQLVLLYAALEGGGMARPLAWTREEALANRARKGQRLVTAETAGEILDILRRAPAPHGRMPAQLSAGAPDVAFKTGTSYGFRDAWAVGASGGYAAVVWVGRPDGAPRPGVTGRLAALPALFDLFDAVARNGLDVASPRATDVADATPETLARFAPADAPPEILFPPDGAELWAAQPGRSFVLAARGAGEIDWYVQGRPVATDASGAPVWSPQRAGFYRLTVVDEVGRASSTRVRVRMP